MAGIELHLNTSEECVLVVTVDDWRVIDDSALAAETAEQAIADAQLDYRVVDVEGHFPASDNVPHIVPVHVAPISAWRSALEG